jgi:hypothetical protein
VHVLSSCVGFPHSRNEFLNVLGYDVVRIASLSYGLEQIDSNRKTLEVTRNYECVGVPNAEFHHQLRQVPFPIAAQLIRTPISAAMSGLRSNTTQYLSNAVGPAFSKNGRPTACWWTNRALKDGRRVAVKSDPSGSSIPAGTALPVLGQIIIIRSVGINTASCLR